MAVKRLSYRGWVLMPGSNESQVRQAAWMKRFCPQFGRASRPARGDTVLAGFGVTSRKPASRAVCIDRTVDAQQCAKGAASQARPAQGLWCANSSRHRAEFSGSAVHARPAELQVDRRSCGLRPRTAKCRVGSEGRVASVFQIRELPLVGAAVETSDDKRRTIR